MSHDPAEGFAEVDRRAGGRWFALVGSFTFVWMVGTAALLAVALHRIRELTAAVGSTPGHTAPASADSKPEPEGRKAEAPAERPTLPETTRVSQVGVIELVELGRSASELSVALRDEWSRAHAASRALVVLVTEDADCPPCRGIDEALPDRRMQEALGRVRLVRVLRSAFKEEVAALRLRTDVYPMFLLLDERASLIDAIHGGEWDEDIAANIAPVLRAFVERTYRDRRHPKWSPAADILKL